MNESLILVGIVEGNQQYAKEIEQMLLSEPDLLVAGIWQDAETAISEIECRQPDVILTDIHLPGMNGIEYIRKASAFSNTIKFLVVTRSDDEENLFEALKAGASGYLLKSEGNHMLIRSIRELKEGGYPFSRQITQKLVRYFNRLPKAGDVEAGLTRREIEVLSLLAEGKMYKEVSVRLGIALETTKKHIRNIYGKLYVQNRTEAINKWRSHRYSIS